MADNKQIEVKTRKRTIVTDLLDYAIREVIAPSSKEIVRNAFTGFINMFSDAATKSVDKWIYPDGAPFTKSRNSTYESGYTNYTVYSRSSNSSNATTQPAPSINQRSSIDIDYIWVDREEDAKYIVGCLVEEITMYGKAKVSTLYEKIKKPTTFTDFKYGWTNANEISYRRDRGKFLIDLPRPINIENI